MAAAVSLNDILHIRNETVHRFVTTPQNQEEHFGRRRNDHWKRTERLINEAANGLRVAHQRGMPLATQEQFTKSILAVILPWGLRWMGGIVLGKILEYMFSLWIERLNNGT